MKKYNHKVIEKKWQKKWEGKKLNQIDLDKAKKPFYNLMMFPYPSAEGLHVGNMYAFVHADAYGRFMRLKGYDVFEPIGLDGFGIHSENYAIKIKEHIKDVSQRTEKHFYQQLHLIGNQYDWSRTVETYKPNYYKWTQWLFLQMYKRGLAYRAKAPVNWCPSCKTVLADEQVISGHCERCSSETEKRQMEQWFFKITDYAERLLNNLSWINWSEEVKLGQRNWIGKSQGAKVKFEVNVADSTGSSRRRFAPPQDDRVILEVFTTRPDTLFGATYMVVCPEHEIIKSWQSEIRNLEEIKKYIKKTSKKSELERTDLAKEKTGVKLKGMVAINPVNKKEMPIFVADYVLAGYGTGAIMAVPAHDQRDWEFAKKYNLEIVEVVKGGKIEKQAFVSEGANVNSEFLDGLQTKAAISKMIKWLEANKLGCGSVHYKLRDWCVSRQRYWGPPIPLVFCENCAVKIKNKKCQLGWHPPESFGRIVAKATKTKNKKYNEGELSNPGWISIPEKELPALLPEMENFLPDGSGKGPLNKVKEFVNTTCPKCGGPAKRETDVSDPFVDSSWYFLRYPCTEFADRAIDKKRLAKWLPVDMYIGGKEHTVLHLLYSRFITMVLHDMGYLKEEEPYKRFFAHGLLICEGAKISKSKGNIVNPDEYIEKFGADSVRLYLMFLGDVRQGGDWRDSGMAGMYRFIRRIWTLSEQILSVADKTTDEEILKVMHRTIKRVGDNLAKLKFNTAIAAIMEYLNFLQDCIKQKKKIGLESVRTLTKLLAPFTPHLAEELWQQAGGKSSIFQDSWPSYNEKLIKQQTIELVIQVNGKVRDRIEVPAEISEAEAKLTALTSEKIKKWLAGAEPKKVIFVKGRLVNIVV